MTAVCIRGRGAARSPEQAAARDSSSDETLIRRIAEGDQLAMRTLFARHRVALYRWLLRLVGDEALAEDLLSEVFLDVWQQAASFEGRSSVPTWLLAIARYKALSARRRRRTGERAARQFIHPSARKARRLPAGHPLVGRGMLRRGSALGVDSCPFWTPAPRFRTLRARLGGGREEPGVLPRSW
jgi:Sigma-70 region 2